MNEDAQLKLQAYLDGELPEVEAAEVKAWLAQDAAAAALLGELRSLKSALAGQEAGIKLPESREFFWSKIEREIERQSREAAPARKLSWFTWVNRHLLPVSGAALVSCLLGVVALHTGAVPGQFGEMEVASDDMGAYTYRDQQAQMTMVWLYDRSNDSEFTDSSSLVSVETE